MRPHCASSPRAGLELAWSQGAARLDARGPYLLGDTLTAADFMLTMLMRWSRNMPRPTGTWPSLRAHAAPMKARPPSARSTPRASPDAT